MPTVPAVNRPAPALSLHSAGKLPITLQSFAGQPIVLAFVARFSADGAEERAVARVRAHLRGLGAVMMVIAQNAVWWFRPDDELELHAAAPELDAATVRQARELYAVPDGAREDPHALTLAVIDGAATLRFQRTVTSLADHPMTMIEQALAAAGRELIRAPAQPLIFSRREMVVLSLVTAFAAVLADACHPKPPAAAPDRPRGAGGLHEVDVILRVNGHDHALRLEPRVSLLDALRERLELTGTKKGCDHGQCGACTVLVGGRRVNACLTLAVMVQGLDVTTIEGLAGGDQLHPMQAAFASEDALQCGYCTPGQIMSAVGLVRENRAHTDDELREAMSGNICRCGAYANIISAIQKGRGSAAT